MPSVNNSDTPTPKKYWRSTEELENSPEFQRHVEREFPYLDEETAKGSVNRRQFLQLMSASMALGGLTACRRPVNKIVPYVRPPEEVIPGRPLYFATTMPFGEEAYGLIVESHEGRPTKVDGNPDHPSTLGKSNMILQASVLGLYDPDRSIRTMQQGQPADWAAFKDAWEAAASERSGSGEGLAILSEASSSPSMSRLRQAFHKTFPQARWVAWEPLSAENSYAGSEIAFGQPLRPIWHFDQAETILSLDADFLLTEDDSVRNAFNFGNRRDPDRQENQGSMNRLYVAEPAYTTTGGMADHRLRIKASRVAAVAAAVARQLGVQGSTAGGTDVSDIDSGWLEAVITDLRAAGSKGLVMAGRRQPPAVHALAAAINERLGSVGTTVTYVEPQDTLHSDTPALQQLVQQMQAGTISTLLIIGGNPAYTAPVQFDFKSALAKVPLSVHLSEHFDATSRLCTWHLARTHYLENWGDARALDGTISLVQPLIAPLYDDSHSDLELVQLIITGEEKSSHDLVRETWREHLGAGGTTLDTAWRRVLHDGLIKGSAFQAANISVDSSRLSGALQSLERGAPDQEIELVFAASPSLHDGRFANNGWLQEMPDPVTKIAWDNAAITSPATARKLAAMRKLNRLGEVKFDMVSITVDGRSLEVALYVQPGHADDSISLELGYGRPEQEELLSVGHGVGFDTYTVRSADIISSGVTVRKSPGTYLLAITQNHHSMEDRPLVREATLAGFTKNGELHPAIHSHGNAQLWKEPVDYTKGYQWGMTIDLNRCTGCNACSIACQSENNIPIVGKTQVSKGREMHWIRIDRYFKGDLENTEGMVTQPVPCQHCENAPCEQVCPVAATVHDDEGLNVMVYNRCIGTRYCSNNCPYKVRRFNFFNYTADIPQTVQMATNPDVTVRFRGVMEKCTFCTQRITEARIDAQVNQREIRDGDVQTACQQACPTNAIAFGSITDEQSRVAELKRNSRNYTILDELLNTRPRVSYLGRLSNPNERLAPAEEEPGHKGH